MMAARDLRARSMTVAIVGEPSEVRQAIPESVEDHGVRVLTCGIDDLAALIGAIQVNGLVVIGDRSGRFVAKLREAMTGSRFPARRLAIVATPGEARAAVFRVLEPD